MATNTGAFFVGVGTTFAILALGFGGGLMMAKTAMEPRVEQHARIDRESSPPVRVILPASSGPAQSPQPSTSTITEHALPTSAASPLKEALVPEKSSEKVDTRKANAEERERRKRYADRKARRTAERAKRKQEMDVGPREAPIVAFGGDESRQRSGFFGN